MDEVLLVVRLALAAVFLVSSAAKFASLEMSRRAAADLGVPGRAAAIVGTTLPFVELAVAIGLVVTVDGRAAAIAAAALLAAFTALLVANLSRGRHPVCRCFGVLRQTPISRGTVVRNVVLFAAAVLVAIAGGGEDPLDLLGQRPAVESAGAAARMSAALPKGEPAWSIS